MSKLDRLQRQVDAFNAACPVGTPVVVRRDSGDEHYGTVRYPASILSGHSAVGWVTGITGCYLLDRIRPATEGGTHA